MLRLGRVVDLDVAVIIHQGAGAFGQLELDEDVVAVVGEDVGLEAVGGGVGVAGAENIGLMGLQPMDDGGVQHVEVAGEISNQQGEGKFGGVREGGFVGADVAVADKHSELVGMLCDFRQAFFNRGAQRCGFFHSVRFPPGRLRSNGSR